MLADRKGDGKLHGSVCGVRTTRAWLGRHTPVSMSEISRIGNELASHGPPTVFFSSNLLIFFIDSVVGIESRFNQGPAIVDLSICLPITAPVHLLSLNDMEG
jgi:hypothetical protein